MPHAEADVDPICCQVNLVSSRSCRKLSKEPGHVICAPSAVDEAAAPRFVRGLNQTRDAHLAFPACQQPRAQLSDEPQRMGVRLHLTHPSYNEGSCRPRTCPSRWI